MLRAISELASLLPSDAKLPGPSMLSAEIWDRVLAVRATPIELAEAWIAALNCDSKNDWRNPSSRIFVLLALTRMFEHLHEDNYQSLKVGLRQFNTRSGRPLSVVGTRCELASRAAEALFLEGRRTPGQQVSNLMLTISDRLFALVLFESRQKDNPQFAKRWYGMKGVCGLMLAIQAPAESPELRREQFATAASDLERSYRLGNCGASAAAYLLDSYLHIFEFDQSPAVCQRIDEIIALLPDEEKHNRSVLAFIGQYWFQRSFGEIDNVARLTSARRALDEALTFPPFLAHDDAFVRLIRGQVLVRLSMVYDDSDPQRCLSILNNAISDLKYAFETAPEKFGKQRSLPSALVSRSDIHSRSRDYENAREDLRYLLDHVELRSADPLQTSQAEFRMLLIPLKEALDRSDLDAIEIELPPIIAHAECSRLGMLVAGLAAKRLFTNKSNVDDPTLLIETIRVMETIDVESIADPATRRTHFSVLAGLLYMLGTTWRPEALELASAQYTEAIAACDEPAAPELLSLHGDCALRLAKYYLREDKEIDYAIELLQEAGDVLLQAAQLAEQRPDLIHESFMLVVTYSKAGEAFLRLCALSGVEEDAQKAVDSFSKALALGNKSYELLGLVGDAYYRLFRIRRRPEFLQLAVSHKRMARDAGGASRENLSLSARLAISQWEYSGQQEDLLSAITLASRAHEASPDWPWPPFQLSEILDRVEPSALQNLFMHLLRANAGLSLIHLVSSQGNMALIDLGCRLVLENDEFAKQNLGGRQPVYVLEDTHGLMSGSYVFKHTDNVNAIRDMDTIRAFSEYLSDRNLRGLRLPKPLAIIPQKDAGTVVYVMRRATGFHLGRLTVRAQLSKQPPPLSEYKRALNFLGAFHAWGGPVINAAPISALSFLRTSLADLLGRDAAQFAPATDALLRRLGRIPQFVKKDAHPENWLIDDHGNLTMIDFESRKPLPAILEVVQLIDDYPLLPATHEGWGARMALCDEYLTTVSNLSNSPNPVDASTVDELYGCFAIMRCAFGLKRASRKNVRFTSSSALRSKGIRVAHHHEVLVFLSRSHGSEGVRALASDVLTDLSAIPRL